MKIKFSFGLLLVFLSLRVYAADPQYAVSAIPEEMKKGCYAVIREKSIRFDIFQVDKTQLTVHQVVTILNKKGNASAMLDLYYDKFRHVNHLWGTVYDESGKAIRKLKQNEIVDGSAVSHGTLFDDDRVKSVDLSQATFPYTVEFDYQVEMKSLFSIPDFDLYDDDEISIQATTYRITYPPDLQPRFKTFKIADPKKELESDGKISLTWTFEKVIPDKFEKDGPDSRQTMPHIQAAPNVFGYDGHNGRMDSWKSYGLWQVQLNKGRDVLPESTIAKMKELTKNLPSREQKVKAIYEYVQNKTRYVSIQLGIGGWQPFEAKMVDEVSYGDCKALSNYTVALLNAVGIKGFYTIVYGGRENRAVVPDFVDNYFNHIIVAVPNEADTIWLECTSQTSPFNYMGGFTGDRKVLMVTEEGGKLVNTPRYPTEKNIRSRTADIKVDVKGDASAKITTSYSGLQYENGYLDYYLGQEPSEQKKWIERNTDIPNFDIKSFTMKNIKDRNPMGIVSLDLGLSHFATVSGKRMFLTANLMSRSTYVPEKVEKRKTNIVVRSGFVHLDTVLYHLPEVLYPEFLPEPVKIKSRFGEYETQYKIEQGQVIFTRKLVMNKGEFPAESYNDWIEFYKSINKADNAKIVFLNKT